MAEPKRDLKRSSVAVVGTGMAGLSAAYLLKNDPQSRFDVEVFEAHDKLSLDSASIDVPAKDGGESTRVDHPMRIFDAGFYAKLKAMYDHLGIKYGTAEYLFSYSRFLSRDSSEKGKLPAPAPLKPYFFYASNNHRIPPIRPENYKPLKWISEVGYLVVFFAYFVMCCSLIPPKKQKQHQKDINGPPLIESFGQYLKRIRLPRRFIRSYLLPPFASGCTCSQDKVLEFPASDFIAYTQRTFRQPHHHVSGGIQTVERKLSKDLKINLSARVTSVTAHNSNNKQAIITWESTTSGTVHQRTFDHVILAIPPSVVGSVFPPLKPAMAHIPTTQVHSVAHTDATAPLNALTSRYSSRGARWIHMRTAADGSTETIEQHPSSLVLTTNPLTQIEPAAVVSEAVFTRTLRTPHSREITNRIFGLDSKRRDSGGRPAGSESEVSWRNGEGNVWLVGSWCWDGMVLLEGCVVSSMRVAEALGVEVPW